jgi:hypothetical protein
MSSLVRFSLPLTLILLNGCSFLPIEQTARNHLAAPESTDVPPPANSSSPRITEAPVTTAPVEGNAEKKNKGPKTVFEWAIGKKDEKKENGEDGNGKENSKDKRRPGKSDLEQGRATNKDANGKDEEEEKRLDPDRPHLPEASSTVGLGRAVLEGGYTYTAKGSFQLHTFPEALLRVGMFADWFEFRIGQSFASEQKSVFSLTVPARSQPTSHAGPNTPNSGGSSLVPLFTTERNTGAQDLYLGFKLGLTEQHKYLPEIAIIPQMTVPSGNKAFSANELLPGVNTDMGWEIAQGRFGLEAVLAVNGAVDDVSHTYVLVDHGLTFIYNPTKKLETFIEWDAFYPAGAVGPATGRQHYIVVGSVYYFTKNFEMDLRAGVGLNEHANDFLVGSGFAIRY